MQLIKKEIKIREVFRQWLSQLLTDSGWQLKERHPSGMTTGLPLMRTRQTDVP